jgi:DNA replication ATP-dependent helicase Dna2
MYYLNKLGGTDHAYPVVKGTIVHEVFGDLLRGRDVEDAVAERVREAGLDLGLLDRDADATAAEVRQHAAAIDGWLRQGRLPTDGGVPTDADTDGTRDADERPTTVHAEGTRETTDDGTPETGSWRSEATLFSGRYGIKGRADAIRDGAPVELKTGKNTKREPRFHDTVQVACYALVLEDRLGEAPDTGTLLYTKNATLERTEESGDLSPAKDVSLGDGLLAFVLRARNEIAAMEARMAVPTGYEADAKCEYCFERDTCLAISGRLDQESKVGTVGEPIPEQERAYFDRFYRAIEAERREVHRAFGKLWQQDAADRAADDRALIDLEPIDQRELAGGRWELRAAATGAVSKIREGDLVLASDGDPVRGTAELARVERVDETIVVTADEPVELRRLDVYPSELSADRMLTALHDALLTRPASAKDVLFDRRAPPFDEEVLATHIGAFVDNNHAQDEAVRLAVAAEDCTLVHGPPGTGKTYALARIVRALADRGERVLLSAFTNRAVDNAVEALDEQGFSDVVRVGTESGVREDIQSYRLDPAGDPGERARMLREAPVVAATTATASSRHLRTQEFDVAVIDEAGQLTEPDALAPIARADRFVLVGDHRQLPPVVRAEDGDGGASGETAALSRSLFERLIDAYPDAGVTLDRQYRMAQRIQAFSSREFYDGALRPATVEVATQTLADLDGVDASALPEHLRDSVTFVDPDGTTEGNANPGEAAAVADVVADFLAAGVAPEDVGVIAPFRAQVAEIGGRVPDGVTVDTVDRFQGSSEEVVVVSFVATGTLESPIFEDYRRVNVALTRAKKALVLVGDRGALESDDLYARMVEWAE